MSRYLALIHSGACIIKWYYKQMDIIWTYISILTKFEDVWISLKEAVEIDCNGEDSLPARDAWDDWDAPRQLADCLQQETLEAGQTLGGTLWQKILKESNRCSHNRAMIEVCQCMRMPYSYNGEYPIMSDTFLKSRDTWHGIMRYGEQSTSWWNSQLLQVHERMEPDCNTYRLGSQM